MDYLDYDPASYWVRRETVHGVLITVAIHNSVATERTINGFEVPIPDEFASLVFVLFHQYWHVFNGFLYDRYTIKVNAMSDPQTFRDALGVGLVLGALSSSKCAEAANCPPHYYAKVIVYEFMPHEMFHAWNGRIISHVPDGQLFQLETWITEGTTSYYPAWALGIVIDQAACDMKHSTYTDVMGKMWSHYQRLVGTEFDLSIEELVRRIGPVPPVLPPPPSDYINMLYARSQMLNYMLAVELSKRGVSLDLLMRELYLRYGLLRRQWRQTDVPRILEEVSGSRFDDFFDAFLYTNARLPLDGDFLFVEHVGTLTAVPRCGLSALQTLRPGRSLRSNGGQFSLTYQGDGNLVLSDDHNRTVLWTTGTAGTSPGQLVMQRDGDLALRDSGGAALWASGTAGNPKAYLVVQSDGHLVIYSSDGRPIWSR